MIYEVALSVLLFFSSQLIYYEKEKKCNWLSASQKFRGSIQVYTSLHVHVGKLQNPLFPMYLSECEYVCANVRQGIEEHACMDVIVLKSAIQVPVHLVSCYYIIPNTVQMTWTFSLMLSLSVDIDRRSFG